MDLSGTDFLSRAASAARDVAREAGALLLGGIDAPRAVDDKGTNDVVTDMDRAADELIIGRLRKLFPLCGMLTEESGNVATAGDAAGDAAAGAGAAGSEDPEDESRYTWVIDPLDGTTSYLHRHPCYSVSIALYDAARGFVVGAVHAPAMDELFLAVRGRGAYLNDRRIHVSATDTLDRALVASGFPYDRRTVEDNNIASFSNVILKVQGFRRNGSAAIDMCYVACGRQDAYWEVVLCPWDYGAGAVIVAEAGGCARNLDGDAELGIGLMTTPVYATNGKPGVQDSLLAAVRETRKAREPVKRG
eukprot:TRINITY_DN4334_c0_g1_i1.p1 TRINITY_DN4334_c0_g1~~TRINITY_DN4334_c0_g1_i1.p1  ORF type:complete len:325 (+),score=127.79 TRINITY_DN4334_c0_g1_i1:65-976(+)